MATNRLNGGVTGAPVEQSGTTPANTQSFTSDGTWSQPDAGGATSVDGVVCAGGGGGMGDSGSGGGAGGFRSATGISVSGPVAVTVGQGGSGGTNSGGSVGSNSVFATTFSPSESTFLGTGGGKGGRAATDG